MAIIDVVSWSPQGNRVVYAWKFPETNLAPYTHLSVQESHSEFLSEEKIPLLQKYGL